jgi:hypothetical protein
MVLASLASGRQIGVGMPNPMTNLDENAIRLYILARCLHRVGVYVRLDPVYFLSFFNSLRRLCSRCSLSHCVVLLLGFASVGLGFRSLASIHGNSNSSCLNLCHALCFLTPSCRYVISETATLCAPLSLSEINRS